MMVEEIKVQRIYMAYLQAQQWVTELRRESKSLHSSQPASFYLITLEKPPLVQVFSLLSNWNQLWQNQQRQKVEWNLIGKYLSYRSKWIVSWLTEVDLEQFWDPREKPFAKFHPKELGSAGTWCPHLSSTIFPVLMWHFREREGNHWDVTQRILKNTSSALMDS